MTRLNQSRSSNNIGYVFKPQVNNDVGIVNTFRNPVTNMVKLHIHEQNDIEGTGHIIQNIYSKGKNSVNEKVSENIPLPDKIKKRNLTTVMDESQNNNTVNQTVGSGLSLAGQGVLPGENLKIKLLKQLKKGKLTGLTTTKDLGKSYQLSGSGGLMDFVVTNIIPTLMKEVGIPPSSVNPDQLKNIIGKSLNLVKSENVTSIIDHLSKTILPILINLKTKSIGGSGLILTGSGKHKTIKTKLIKSLSKGLTNSFKHYIKLKKKGQHGNGLKLAGQGFFEDFKKGFVSVFKPASKIISSIATVAGVPELGIPLNVISDLL